jgi:hypothetical protein
MCMDTDENIGFLTLRRAINGPMPPSLQYILAGSPSWCYSGPLELGKMQPMFPGLLKKAVGVGSWVTTFLPSEGLVTDGRIKVVIMFDQSLLQTLFGRVMHETIDAGT